MVAVSLIPWKENGKKCLTHKNGINVEEAQT
jgi:hypothetical protein